MFWTFINAITDGFISLADNIFSIFTKVDAVGFLVTIAVIGMFISFVVFNRIGLLSKSGSSDKVKKH